ncbi:casein kinase II regulatory subunit-domain-containing protein [Absidia repens]|uniref:Casein kinase II subunit beta n=1 Tax=Absidia repens TaxID=90262 RepID=A0A1X2J2C9_9FUNG|nr:casein kinase II regulatory subunit-domain-containing protein [Absidia repens]
MFVNSSQGNIDYGFDRDSQVSTGSSLQSWVSWFCSLSGHEYYAEVSDDFMDDDFNLTGLSALVPYYNEALDMILDIEYEDDDINDYDDEEEGEGETSSIFGDHIDNSSNNNNNKGIGLGDSGSRDNQQEQDDGFWKEQPLTKRRAHVDPSVVEPYAVMLYGLIHQRFLLTRNGLRLMAERYASGEFGFCPRTYCGKCPVIPTGRYDEPGRENVKLYCPCCMDLYNPPFIYQNVDGAHFGTTYSHLMFQTYSELTPLAQRHIYQPKIFGFRINERSRTGPRMQWLRMRPPEYTENSDTGDADDDLDDDELEDDLEDMNQIYEDDIEEAKDQVVESTTNV